MIDGTKTYSLVFLGDNLVENMHGLEYNNPTIAESEQIATLLIITLSTEASKMVSLWVLRETR
jgi:hypothetical protein